MTRALNEAQRAALLGQIPMGRLGTPEDIAAAVLFLVLPAGRLHHRRDPARQRRHVHALGQCVGRAPHWGADRFQDVREPAPQFRQ